MGLLLGAPAPRGDAKPHDTNCNPTTVFNGEEGSAFDWVSQARCSSEITDATRRSPWWDLRWLPLLGEGFPKASLHRWMLSATVAVDRVIQVAGFTHPAPRSCLGSSWRDSACTKNDGKALRRKSFPGRTTGSWHVRGWMEKSATIFPEGAEKKWVSEQPTLTVEP